MPSQKQGRQWLGMTLGALVVLYLLGVGVIVIGAAAFGGGGSSTTEATTADISLSEFKISGTLQVPAGKVTLAVKNVGGVEHNLTFTSTGEKTKNLSAGTSENLVLNDLKAGTYEVFCSIAGHKESGMTTNLVVTDGASGAAAAAAAPEEHHGNDITPADAKKLDDSMMNMMATFGTDAVKTEGVGNTPLEPTIAADGAKEFEITAAITKWEVEPGVIVDAWTYNGQVPGPWIKVNVGDKVRVHLINELPLGTDIHFHGIHTPKQFRRGVAVHPAEGRTPGRRVHLRVRRGPTGRRHVPRPHAR